MEYRQLGHSGLEVSVLSLGSWLTYEFIEEEAALAVIKRALEGGINFLDDARYNDRTGKAPLKSGYSEVLFGRLLRQTGWNRADLVIANKLWYEFYPEESPEAELDGSLGRMQLDYLDLVYCAAPSDKVSVTEIVQQMAALLKTGKVKSWGVMNWPVDQIEEAWQVATAAGTPPPCAAQLPYSLLNRASIEDERSREIFRTTGIGLVASYSLYGGLLSGKYNNSPEAIKGRFGADAVETMRQKGLLEKANQVASLAQVVGCTPAQLALAYVLKNDQVASLLFGATKISQVEENLQTLEILPRIDQEMLAKLRQLE
jgi:aryl-alcohol dehydrogenase-like predicted oxidoreductase